MNQLHPVRYSTKSRLRCYLLPSGRRITLLACLSLTAFLYLDSKAGVLPLLTSGHTDVGIGFINGEWELQVHVESLELEYDPQAVRLAVSPLAVGKVPDTGAHEFLGQPGAPLWVLPEVGRPGVLFLGLGTEEIPHGMFSDGTVRLHLKTVSGPGHFALWHTDALGNAVVSMNTRDGIDDRDLRLLQAGSHAHVNWAFTAPGLYRLGFEASGILSQTSETVRSGIVEFLFEVYEAPSLSLSFGDNGMITLRWNSLEHHFYQLQSMADAFQGWSDHPCSAAVEGTGDAVSLEIDLGEGTRFFRLAMRGEDHHHPEAE